MVRVFIFSTIIIFFSSCGLERFRSETVHWQRHDHSGQQDSVVELSQILHLGIDALHDKSVSIRGKLVYEFDEASIRPQSEDSDLNLIWLHVSGPEKILHEFLLKSDGSIVTVQGRIDAKSSLHSYPYSFSLREISYVSAKLCRRKDNPSCVNESGR